MQMNRFDICSEHLRVPWLIQLFVLSAFPPDLEETRLLCAQMWRAWPDAVMSTSSRWRSGAREKSWCPSQSASNSHLRGQRHVTKLRYVVTFSKEVVHPSSTWKHERCSCALTISTCRGTPETTLHKAAPATPSSP